MKRCDERPEDDQEDEQCGEQPEQLLRSLLDRRELRVAVELDRHSDGLDGLADGLLHGDDRLTVLVVDHPVELGLGVPDPPVLGDRAIGEEIADALDPRALLRWRELVGAEQEHRLLDRCLPLGRVQALALRRREHEVENTALLGGELGLDQVGRLLGVRARDLERVAELTAEGADEADEDDDDRDPADHDLPRVPGAPPRPAGEPARGEAFVGGKTFRHVILPRSHRDPSLPERRTRRRRVRGRSYNSADGALQDCRRPGSGARRIGRRRAAGVRLVLPLHATVDPRGPDEQADPDGHPEEAQDAADEHERRHVHIMAHFGASPGTARHRRGDTVTRACSAGVRGGLCQPTPTRGSATAGGPT